jgi:hypothetical protein
MNDQPTRQRFPSWKQALLILAAGIVLALSSCAAFLSTISSADNLSVVFAVAFLIGVGGAVVGFALVLVRATRG